MPRIKDQELGGIKVSSSRSYRPGYATQLNRMYDIQDIEAQRFAASQDPFSRFNIPTQEVEDYTLEPTFRSVHGVPIEERIPKLKPPIPEASSDLVTLGRAQAGGLRSNLQSMIKSQNIRGRLNPLDPRAHSGFLGNMLLKVEGLRNSRDASEFAEFKSQTQQLFQQYRKYITGVQAGFPELQMLAPVFPETTDPPSQYVSKALGALGTMKSNDEIYLKALGERGFRTRQLRQSGLGVNPDELRQQAIQGGINVSPVPGMQTGVNVDQERQEAIKRIQSGKYDAKKVAEIFRQRTGQELNV